MQKMKWGLKKRRLREENSDLMLEQERLQCQLEDVSAYARRQEDKLEVQ